MKVILCHPGASYSTADVYFGLKRALEAQGHEVIQYALDGRIAHAGKWLHIAWRMQKSAGNDLARPSPADVQYQAGYPVIERALRFLPDWVIVVSGMYLHPDVFIMLKRAGIRVAVILTESPYDDERQSKILPHVDMAWTNERTSVPYLRQFCPNVEYLPHGIDPERHRPDGPIDEAIPSHDVVHVGTLFQERKELLERVNWDGIDLGLYGTFDLLGSKHRLRRYIRGDVQDNARTAGLYRRAKIGLNMHRTSIGFGARAPRISYAESLGPRVYELAATGCFFLTDDRAELHDVFDDVVPTFRQPAELEALIRRWLPADAERACIARQLPGMVAGHTFAARARQIAERLQAGIPQMSFST